MLSEARDSAEPDLAGAIVQDRYRIVRRIAQGGMGAVYEAEHVKLGKRLAIKTLLPSVAGRPDMLLRFEREARAASAIGHPGIVDVRDMGELPDGTPYMVLELLEGEDWEARIEAEGPQPVGRTVRIARRVCDALGAAHERGIVHRDLKPANVFLVGDGEEIKLLDFGVARFRPDGVEEATLTRPGTALGTVRYMSPEQAKGAPVDARTDLWALGVALFRALTGAYPFDDHSLPMLVVKICSDDPPSLLEHRRDVPPELDAVVRRLLARDPDGRFESCAELAEALEPWVATDEEPAVRDDAPDRRAADPSVLSGTRERGGRAVDTGPTSSPARWRTAWIAALVGLAAAAGAAVWWVSAREGTPERVPDGADAVPVRPAPSTEGPTDPAASTVAEPDDSERPGGETPAGEADPSRVAPAAEALERDPPTRSDAPRQRREPPPSGTASRRGPASPPAPREDGPAGRGFRTTPLTADEF